MTPVDKIESMEKHCLNNQKQNDVVIKMNTNGWKYICTLHTFCLKNLHSSFKGCEKRSSLYGIFTSAESESKHGKR